MRRLPAAPLGALRAVILHRPHATVDALARQLHAIGLAWDAHWPDLPPEARGAGFAFFDVDRGHDAQFPWAPGRAPMPTVALIGSEAPGRVEWALAMGADAQILKPVGDGGVHSALLIARAAFEARRALAAEAASLRARLDAREDVVRAALVLPGGYDALRRRAMAARATVEEEAARVLAEGSFRVRRRPA